MSGENWNFKGLTKKGIRYKWASWKEKYDWNDHKGISARFSSSKTHWRTRVISYGASGVEHLT